MSAAEDLLAFQLKAVGIPFEREVVFAAPRKWRADFVLSRCKDWPCTTAHHQPFLIEIDGGAFVAGRHGRGAGIRSDLEKLNRATELGYRVLRLPPENIEDGSAL